MVSLELLQELCSGVVIKDSIYLDNSSIKVPLSTQSTKGLFIKAYSYSILNLSRLQCLNIKCCYDLCLLSHAMLYSSTLRLEL